MYPDYFPHLNILTPGIYLHHEGYNITSRDPVWRQQRDENSKACDCKVKIEKPRQQLEGVRRPAPPVCPGAQGHVGSSGHVIAHRHRAVRVPAAQVHERVDPSSSGLWGTTGENTSTTLNNSDSIYSAMLLAKPSRQLWALWLHYVAQFLVRTCWAQKYVRSHMQWSLDEKLRRVLHSISNPQHHFKSFQ